ncbi:MAG: class I SAM-dependent methyltransferase [Mariniblastus sp.]
MTNQESEWWRNFHVIEMADLFLERSSQAELDETTNFLIEELNLKPGMHVYDQCCGTGTISFELAKHSISVSGADLCETYIERAIEVSGRNEPTRSAPPSRAQLEFHCADAFEFVPDKPCDAVFNWFSSFGYASTNEKNRRMLARAFDSLKPGCRFTMDVPNFPGLIRGFQKYMVRTGESNGKSVTCVRECSVNLRSGLLEQTWNWIVEGRSVDQRKSALRIYFPHEIVEMLTDVGFETINLYGGLNRSELEMDSPRLIVTARKPA